MEIQNECWAASTVCKFYSTFRFRRTDKCDEVSVLEKVTSQLYLGDYGNKVPLPQFINKSASTIVPIWPCIGVSVSFRGIILFTKPLSRSKLSRSGCQMWSECTQTARRQRGARKVPVRMADRSFCFLSHSPHTRVCRTVPSSWEHCLHFPVSDSRAAAIGIQTLHSAHRPAWKSNCLFVATYGETLWVCFRQSNEEQLSNILN